MRMSGGSLFHNLGAAMAKEQSPHCLHLGLGTSSKSWTPARVPDGEDLGQIGGRQAGNGLKNKHQKFKINSKTDWKPVERRKDRGDMLASGRAG